MDLPPKPEPDRCGGRGSLEGVGALVASRSHRMEPVEVVDRQLNFVAGPVDFRIEAGRATAVTASTALVGPQTPRLGTSSHPRVHGEHGPEQGCAYANAGPPPRARGPLAGRHGAALARGATPACVGTTLDPEGQVIRREGPPPRVRGPPLLPLAAGRAGRTTPACAGTTRRGSAAPPSGRDHPRVRGDHRRRSATMIPSPGPPPRARGPPLPGAVLRADGGTTPACAGTTFGYGKEATA